MIEAHKYRLKNLHRDLADSISADYSNPEKESIAYLIIEKVLDQNRTSVITNDSILLDKGQTDQLNRIVLELNRNKPIQHILGSTEFMGLELRVNDQTLIPRQETEELVDLIVKENPSSNLKVLDIGTGSGCIAIALSKFLKDPDIYALDNSVDALEVASGNAEIHNLKINFFHHDIIHDAGLSGTYDIIVSNPPYVLESEKSSLHDNVLNHEPHSALFVHDDKALVYYECIVELSFRHLKPNGKIYFEINEAKGNSVNKLLTECGFKDVRILRDIHGKDRFASGCCRS